MSKPVQIHAPNMPWHGAEVVWRTGSPPSDGFYLSKPMISSDKNVAFRLYHKDGSYARRWSSATPINLTSDEAYKSARHHWSWTIKEIFWCDWRPSK